MTIAGETARNNNLKFCTKTDLFAYREVDLFLFFFFSTSVALNILSLYPLFRDFEYFVSSFGCSRFWAPTHFPELICLRYDPALVHDGKKARALLSVAKVEKTVLPKDNKVQSARIKYFINGKPVVINRPINKLFYLTEPMKNTSDDIRPTFVDDSKICKIVNCDIVRYFE